MCPTLPDPLNGSVMVTGRDVGNQALYACNAKFKLVGQLTRICLSSGSWSGSAAMCVRKLIYIIDMMLIIACLWFRIF